MNLESSKSLFKFIANTSNAIIKKVGESQSPCFSPLDDWKKPKDSPFIRIEYQ